MYKSTNTTWSTTFPLDKESKKRYTESTQMKLNLAAFDDDEVAGAAVDYLYAPGNQSKTQTFLKNNGFPSAQEREFGKELLGVQQERKNLMDEFKSKVKTPVNTEHYGESDRAFMQGLLGDEEGEREYQKRVANVNAQNAQNIRKQNELLNAFQGSPFEGLLRPSVPVSGVTQNQGERISALQPMQTSSVTKQMENKQFPSGLKNRDYSDKGFWYVESANNSPGQTKPKVSPNAVRANVERSGGTVNWDPESEKATVSINGYTEEFYVGDANGTFIQDGVMYTDDLHLNNIIYAPKHTQVKNIYDEITDDFGKFVLRTWLYGDGSEVNVSGEKWSAFINNNMQVQKKFMEKVGQAIADGKTSFDVTDSVILTENNKGGYKNGYELINGSNHKVGDFAMRGNISALGNGRYFVTIDYTFNDIIDPNEKYRTDRYYSKAADFLGVSGKDYILRISGNANFIYRD